MGVVFKSDVNIKFSNRTFIINKKSCKLSIDEFDELHASGNSKLNIEKATLSAIGEFVERETMFENAFDYKHGNKNFNSIGYSIARNCMVDLERDFTDNFDYYFQDSCGMASHLSSNDCLLNALCEYVERQSFIYNYLSKMPADYYDIKEIADYDDIYSIFPDSNLKFYQISLSDIINVVFAKGIYKNRVMIGLGSAINIKEAIDKCIKELYQCKEVYDLAGDKKIQIKGLKYGEYGKIFFSLDTEQIWRAYNYLDSCSNPISFSLIEEQSASVKNICLNLYGKYKMDPIIVFLNRQRNISSYKVIKIIDKKWFNNLLVKDYSLELYSYIEQITGKKLDKRCTFIPFP